MKMSQALLAAALVCACLGAPMVVIASDGHGGIANLPLFLLGVIELLGALLFGFAFVFYRPPRS